jgi:REP element-mobilizing transposase RayT
MFGKIENNEMILNDVGKIANQYWAEIPAHFPNAILHEHIVMPDHLHGIIEIISTGCPCRDTPWHVPTLQNFQLHHKQPCQMACR